MERIQVAYLPPAKGPTNKIARDLRVKDHLASVTLACISAHKVRLSALKDLVQFQDFFFPVFIFDYKGIALIHNTIYFFGLKVSVLTVFSFRIVLNR